MARSWKNVLGETSLERKCRLLFGFWLTVLISGAFWGVDRVAYDLVIENTRSGTHDQIQMRLLGHHFNVLDTREDFTLFSDEIVSQIWDRAATADNTSVLILDGDPVPTLLDSAIGSESSEDQYTPKSEVETSLITALKERYRDRQTQGDGNNNEGPVRAIEGVQFFDVNEKVMAAERIVAEQNEYHYYEQIHWANVCTQCHRQIDSDALAVGEGADTDIDMFAVLKMVMPFDETKQAMDNARALLITVAIVTVFVAMIALYVIIRLLVVRPLKHLTVVSESIGRGDLKQRADISTDDEFEHLATSFNRMVRHLTEAQDELKNVNLNLDGKIDELAQVNVQLYEMNRLKDDFLANMSHELRTPLNSILGFSDVLKDNPNLDEKQNRYIQNIRSSGQLLLEMINDVLDLAKIEAGKMEVKPAEIDLRAIVEAQCDLVASLINEKSIDLEKRVETGDQLVYQDQSKIQQILTNLLSNAIKFTPESGRITVTTIVRNEQIEMTVADTGVGISEEDQEVFFEKFRQGGVSPTADNFKREFSGTGLGLSIIKEMCRILGGEISLESQIGVGSTFKVVLPAYIEPESVGELMSTVTSQA